jgi:hypothetical protein
MASPCNNLTDPLGCGLSIIGNAAGSVAGSAVPAAWDAICKSFADGAAQLFQAFGQLFTKIPDVNPVTAGIATPYGITLVLGCSVAALLILGQVMRTAWTHDGTGMAQALSGTVKALLAWALTVAVATAAISAADQATRMIVNASFGSQQALAVKLGQVVNWSGMAAGQPGQAVLGASLLLVMALIGIILVIVLWFELLLRNAALAILIAISPIPAAGQAGGEATRSWWTRTVAASAQLIILKPIIALVFAVGFAMPGQSQGIAALLQGLLVLGLAAFCWPVIARFFTFGTIQSAGSGLAAVLGFVAGNAIGRAGGGQGTAGVNPDMFSRSAEARTMGGGGAGGTSAGGGALGGAATTGGGAGGRGGGSGGGTGGAVLAGIGMALRTAQQAGAALAGRMEQTAAHAGMHGAYPYSRVQGSPGYGYGRPAQRAGGGTTSSAPSQAAPPGQASEPGQGSGTGPAPAQPQEPPQPPPSTPGDPPTGPLPATQASPTTSDATSEGS